jgi:hypothetical protein
MRHKRQSEYDPRVRHPGKSPKDGYQTSGRKEDISTLVKRGHFYFGLTFSKKKLDK